MAQNGLNPPLRRHVTPQLSSRRFTHALSRGIFWLTSRFGYSIFRLRRYCQKAKARRNDPNIYPLW
jgi:hypothetical protein